MYEADKYGAVIGGIDRTDKLFASQLTGTMAVASTEHQTNLCEFVVDIWCEERTTIYIEFGGPCE